MSASGNVGVGNRRRPYVHATAGKKATPIVDDTTTMPGQTTTVYQQHEDLEQSSSEHQVVYRPQSTTTMASTVYRLIQLPADGIGAVQLQSQQSSEAPSMQIVLGTAPSAMSLSAGRGGADVQMQHQVAYNQPRQQSRQIQLQTVDTPTGQCYLLMNPQEFVAQRNDKGIIPTTTATFIPLSRFDGLSAQSSSPVNSQSSPTGNVPNDPQYTVKRRVSHNEVEKRRRDKINQWINRLARLLPDGDIDETSRQMQSKGGTLAKTVEFIQQLKDTNQQLVNTLNQKCGDDLESRNIANLRDELDQMTRENIRLRDLLRREGISPDDEATEAKREKLNE